MAIALEAFCIVVRISGLEPLGGLEGFQALAINGTFCHDEDLARYSFMDRSDAVEFIGDLQLRGLHASDDPSSNLVLVDSFDGNAQPHCDWFQMAEYKKSRIGWLTGSEPRTISAPQGWNPDAESRIYRMSNEEAAKRLKFLRRENNVEVFLDTETGEELFVGRTGLPLDQMFEEARDFVFENLRQPGEPVSSDDVQSEFRRVIEMLQIFTERRPQVWAGFWLLGKAWHAIGDSQRGYELLQRAHELEKTNTAITKELAGICLELGHSEQAVVYAEAAVAEVPDDSDLISNLALAYLFDGRLTEAINTAAAAVRAAPDDSVNQAVHKTVNEVRLGRRPQPKRLGDLG